MSSHPGGTARAEGCCFHHSPRAHQTSLFWLLVVKLTQLKLGHRTKKGVAFAGGKDESEFLLGWEGEARS